jgi:hypothetical protein
VRYLSAEGSTNLYGALKAAFEDEEMDSLVLLSDGDPTMGDLTHKPTILEAVEKWNRTMQATIHVVALGDADRFFLRALAVNTGGTFVSH